MNNGARPTTTDKHETPREPAKTDDRHREQPRASGRNQDDKDRDHHPIRDLEPVARQRPAGSDIRPAAADGDEARMRKTSPIERASFGGVTWILGKKLGEGSFGEIYQATNEKDASDVVAVKLGRGEGKDMLQREAKILYQLRGYDGVPEVRACYSEGEWYVMVMQLLGISLSDLLMEYDLNLKAILILADQMIQHLEYIHSKNIIHGDLKPSNFLLGKGEQRNRVLLIDFGLCEEYRNPETKKHIPYSDKHGFHGTPRYCSLHVHNGIASSRRDDMESLGYVLIYLFLGKLPWQNLPAEENETKKQKRRKIAEMKQNLPVEELCAGMPEEFVQYINITRNLKFKQKPNYYALRMLFRDLFVRQQLGSYDDDWISTLERKKKKRRTQRLKKPDEDGPEGPKVPGKASPRSPREPTLDPVPRVTGPSASTKKLEKQQSKWQRFLSVIKPHRDTDSEKIRKSLAKKEKKEKEEREKEEKERLKEANKRNDLRKSTRF